MARLRLQMSFLVLLLLHMMLSAKGQEMEAKSRKKREWILPPAKLMENTDYTHKEFIAKTRSDNDEKGKVDYYLSGPGANKPPINLFLVDHDTGFVTITDILDREKYLSYNVSSSTCSIVVLFYL
ncbi:cadherin-1-like [Cynoglossus semilaevis]|uniref:cadherin-1-like n=1 Tax=Cynoglossus semilaevis TaxID=244447 RepID=UPI000D625719|nr:cadherin-1-like [Cynoglossus semilaevis]